MIESELRFNFHSIQQKEKSLRSFVIRKLQFQENKSNNYYFI